MNQTNCEECLHVCFEPTYTLRDVELHGGTGIYDLRFCIFHWYIALLVSFAVELLRLSQIHCKRNSIILEVQKRSLNHLQLFPAHTFPDFNTQNLGTPYILTWMTSYIRNFIAELSPAFRIYRHRDSLVKRRNLLQSLAVTGTRFLNSLSCKSKGNYWLMQNEPIFTVQ